MLFILLVATNFGHFNYHQTNATQNLQRQVTCSVHVTSRFKCCVALV